MNYPGLAFIGSGKISGLYGLNDTIHDQKSTGLQHLYIDNYETDFIYSATSVVKLDDKCYYGDRIKPQNGHPMKIKSKKSYCHEGFVFTDEFYYEKFNKKFQENLSNQNINGVTIKKGESLSGLIGIRSDDYKSIKIKVD
jgi:hypothetical protein